MFFKRKRSNSELTSPLRPSSNFSTPQSCATQYNTQFTYEITPPHLTSRTRKRVRDNRPAEEAIHQNTLNLLFQAQKHQQPAQEEAIEIQMKDSTPSHSRQSSLHSFWSLPTRPASRPTSSHLSQSHTLATPPLQDISCSSCDIPLVNQDGDPMGIDADVEAGFSDFHCESCKKPFCHNCSISNLGAQRHCLKCVGRKRWVGGLGWVTA